MTKLVGRDEIGWFVAEVGGDVVRCANYVTARFLAKATETRAPCPPVGACDRCEDWNGPLSNPDGVDFEWLCGDCADEDAGEDIEFLHGYLDEIHTGYLPNAGTEGANSGA